jgi:hypothetical protein
MSVPRKYMPDITVFTVEHPKAICVELDYDQRREGAIVVRRVENVVYLDGSSSMLGLQRSPGSCHMKSTS